MKAKLRSVNTKFWEDPFVEGLKPDEKLLFLYLLTNPLANMLGIYEISVKRISYDTGINQDRVKKIFKGFESVGKALRENDYVIMPNWLKNQSLNSNMQTGALNIYNDLPNWLRDRINEKPLKGFKSLRNAMLNMKGNMKGNMNIEDEVEKEEGVIFPFDSEEFKKWWGYWKEYKSKDHKFKYKSHISEQAALKELSNFANGNENIALQIIEQSIAKGWKGFFELKTDQKQYNTDPAARAAMREKIGAEFARKWKNNEGSR